MVGTYGRDIEGNYLLNRSGLVGLFDRNFIFGVVKFVYCPRCGYHISPKLFRLLEPQKHPNQEIQTIKEPL